VERDYWSSRCRRPSYFMVYTIAYCIDTNVGFIFSLNFIYLVGWLVRSFKVLFFFIPPSYCLLLGLGKLSSIVSGFNSNWVLSCDVRAGPYGGNSNVFVGAFFILSHVTRHPPTGR
jgi:hypothetical protein